MEIIRVLHVLDSLSNGGAESFLMNVYRSIDKTKVQFDFLIRREINIYKDEIREMGGEVFLAPSFPQRILSNYIETQKILKNGKYQIIHVHANSLVYIVPLLIAKKIKIPHVIMHSHSTLTASNSYLPIHKFNKHYINKLTTKLFACGNNAGEWMFGDNDFEVINNGVEINKFRYSDIARYDIRNEFNISENELLVGHVGRFVEPKNHEFIIDIFFETLKIQANSKLILVGTGKHEEKIKRKIQNLNIEDKVIFSGSRKDINKFMSAFDILLFPSLFEGLPVVLVEAQAAGLKCLISDNITDEVIISDLVIKNNLSNGVKDWADKLIKMVEKDNRQDTTEIITKSGYNIEDVARKLENYYLSTIEIGEF